MDINFTTKRNLKIVFRLVTATVLLASLSINSTGQQRVQQYTPVQIDQRVLEQQRRQQVEQHRMQQQLEQQRRQQVEQQRRQQQLEQLTADYQSRGRPERPHSALAKARQKLRMYQQRLPRRDKEVAQATQACAE